MAHSFFGGVAAREREPAFPDRLFPKRPEARAKLFGEKLGIGPLRPGPRRLVEFVRPQPVVAGLPEKP
jgi:hypothetical protein